MPSVKTFSRKTAKTHGKRHGKHSMKKNGKPVKPSKARRLRKKGGGNIVIVSVNNDKIEISKPENIAEYNTIRKAILEIFADINEKKLINDKIKLKNNGISRLLKYFNKEDFWYMDILYATAIANDQEKILYKEILDEICKNILDSDLLDLIQIDYINTLYDIINGTNKDIEQYLHNYTSVDIPNIVNGKIKPLI